MRGLIWAIILVVIIVLIVIFVGGNLSNDEGELSGDPIKIGFVGALTGDGAVYGEEDGNAAMMAVENVNAQGGINGRPLKLIMEDGLCTPTDATNAARKLIDIDKVKFILGGTCSGETLAIAPLAEDNNILLFSSYSTNPSITDAGDFVFRNSPSDSDSGSATANMAIRNGVKTISAIVENTDFASGYANVFKTRFEEQGGTVNSFELFAPEIRDFRVFVTKAMSSNPDAILVSPQGKTGGIVIKQLKELGYEGPVYGSIVLNGDEMFELSEGATEGIYYSDTAELSSESGRTAEFLDLYESTYGEAPAFGYYAGARWDAVHVLAEALREVGEDPEAVKNYLYNLEGYPGATGTFGFDSNGDVTGIEFADFQINSTGTGVPIQ